MQNVATPVMPPNEAGRAAIPRPAAPAPNEAAQQPASQNQIAELRVSGHLMTLDTGLFCVFPAAGGPVPDPASGLPGVRVSLPPGPVTRPDAVSISTFREDGWLAGGAALVRILEGPGQVLVTVYQSSRPGEAAPRLQVLRLTADGAAGANGSATATQPQPQQPVAEPDIVAHVQRTGDMGVRAGEWIGVRGSKMWVEGFGISPRDEIPPGDIEYQAVLGRGWLSPWVEAGKFCGSRGMALPLLGLNVRLKGEAARRYDCRYSATFTDGSEVGPVSSGEACEAESLAALEAFQIEFTPRGSNARGNGARAIGARANSPAGNGPAGNGPAGNGPAGSGLAGNGTGSRKPARASAVPTSGNIATPRPTRSRGGKKS